LKFLYLLLIGFINVFSNQCIESTILFQKLNSSYLLALKEGNTFCSSEPKGIELYKKNNFCSLSETKESFEKVQRNYNQFEHIKNIVINIPLENEIDNKLEAFLLKSNPGINLIWNLKDSYLKNGEENIGYCKIDFCNRKPMCKAIKNSSLEINFSTLKNPLKIDSLILEINKILDLKVSNLLEFAQYYSAFYNPISNIQNNDQSILSTLIQNQKHEYYNPTLNNLFELTLSEIIKALLIDKKGIYFTETYTDETQQIFNSLNTAKNCSLKPASITFLIGRIVSTRFNDDFNKEILSQLQKNSKCMK
jgi:hypothetical protein